MKGIRNVCFLIIGLTFPNFFKQDSAYERIGISDYIPKV